MMSTTSQPQPQPHQWPRQGNIQSAAITGAASMGATAPAMDSGVCNYIDLSRDAAAAGGRGAMMTMTKEVEQFARRVHEECGRVKRHGFQVDNVRNQQENVTMLLANIWSTGRGDIDSAIEELYNRTFSSYGKWMKMMPSEKQAWEAQLNLGVNKMLERIMLWWCMWGECANLRFMPELLSWAFYRLQARRDHDLPQGNFLATFVKPMYTLLKKEMGMGFGTGKVDMAGIKFDHTSIKNYDDINEFFWTVQCLRDDYQVDSPDALIEHLQSKHKKTYMERRGILHSIKSNMRVITFYMVLFHVLVIMAHDVPFSQTALPLCPPQDDESSLRDHAALSAEQRHQERQKLLELMPPNPYVSCNWNTAVCTYTDLYSHTVSYNCLDQLEALNQSGKVEQYNHLNDDIPLLYLTPFLGNLFAVFDPSTTGGFDDVTGLWKTRAKQLQLFDPLWLRSTAIVDKKRVSSSEFIEDQCPCIKNHTTPDNEGSWIVDGSDTACQVCERKARLASYHHTPKWEIMSKHNDMMTCDFHYQSAAQTKFNSSLAGPDHQLDAQAGWVDDFILAANASFCCRVDFTSKDAHRVWKVRTDGDHMPWCQWSLRAVFVEWGPAYQDTRTHLLGATVTLTALRVVAQLLNLWVEWGSASSINAGGCLGCFGSYVHTGRRLVYYLFMLILLIVSAETCDHNTCGQGLLEELRAAVQHHILGHEWAKRLFLVVCIVVVIVELAWSVLPLVERLLTACMRQKHIDKLQSAQKCFQIFPPLYTKIKGPMNSRLYLKYATVWFLIICAKSWFSYYFEIRLQIVNEATTWAAIIGNHTASHDLLSHEHFWERYLFTNIRTHLGDRVVAFAVTALMWIPIVIVFMLDTQIIFTMAQMFFGVFNGVNLRIGHVNSWDQFCLRFPKLLPKFEKNIIASNSQALQDAYTGSKARWFARSASGGAMIGAGNVRSTGLKVLTPTRSSTGLQTPLIQQQHSVFDDLAAFDIDTDSPTNDDPLSTQSFHRFAMTWNIFIDKLRYDDYLSDSETELYKCLEIEGGQWTQGFLPCHIQLGEVERVLQAIDDAEDAYRRAWQGASEGTVFRDDWLHHTMELCEAIYNKHGRFQLSLEALSALKYLSLFVLTDLLGDNELKNKLITASRGPVNSEGQTRLKEWALLMNLLQQPDESTPAARSASKIKRRALVEALAKLAETVSTKVCRLPPGLSKQPGVYFDRCHVRLGFVPTDAATLQLIRDLLKSAIEQVKYMCEAVILGGVGRLDVDSLHAPLEKTLTSPFFTDDEYAKRQLERVAASPQSLAAASYLKHLLSSKKHDAEPKCEEARRRLLFFATSMHMNMPGPKQVNSMRSLTTLTPMYGETVLYTKKDIATSTLDKPSLATYLRATHAHEWENMLERLGITDAGDGALPPGDVWDGDVKETEFILWASLRGQTLGRTVHGVMQGEAALLVLAQQEDPSCSHVQQSLMSIQQAAAPANSPVWTNDLDWVRQAHMKFQYVVTCQIYGQWVQKRDPKKTQVELLMRLFPHLRVAYVDENEVDLPNGEKTKTFHSCLARWCSEEQKVVTCYRVELPGHILIGEGKPNNQNHAIIFTRGEYIQTLDMNQDNYFEEGLKIRNLLEEFAPETTAKEKCGAGCTAFCAGTCPCCERWTAETDRVRIVGFPEHQFSANLSAVAEFAALTELTFATMIQRSLASPFDVRMHYGHPDIFDRLFHVTRGSISKASKTINVSEDIFGGFQSVFKGGRVVYKEYTKCGKGKDLGFDDCAMFEAKISAGNGEMALSRDFYRMSEELDFPRALSFFQSNNGFYWSNVLVIWATSWFLYVQILISVILPDSEAWALLTVTQSVAFSIQLGAVLTIPLVAELTLVKGPLAALWQMARVLFTGGPLFFMFHIKTKAHYYEQALIVGGAGYRATGRNFVLQKKSFLNLFQMFQSSHLDYGLSLVLNLLVYRAFIVDPDRYLAVSWSTWMFALVLLYAPFIFNCSALDAREVAKDMEQWREFIWRDDLQGHKIEEKSWRAHFDSTNQVYNNLSFNQRLQFILRNMMLFIMPIAILIYKNANNMHITFWKKVATASGLTMLPTFVVLLFLVMPLLFCINMSRKGRACLRKCGRRCGTFNIMACLCCQGLNCGCGRKLKSRRRQRLMTMAVAVAAILAVIEIIQQYDKPSRIFAIYSCSIGYVVAFVTNFSFYICRREQRPNFVYSVMWLHDYVQGYLILLPIRLLSSIRAFHDAHMRLLYNSQFAEVLRLVQSVRDRDEARKAGVAGVFHASAGVHA